MLNLIYTAGYAAIVSCISDSIITDGTVTTGLGSTIMMKNLASSYLQLWQYLAIALLFISLPIALQYSYMIIINNIIQLLLLSSK
jgi:hypothetical protein